MRWFSVVAAGLLIACGGVVERSPEGGEAGPTPPPPAGNGNGAEDDPNGIDPNADTELGECVLGYAETWIRPCAWVAEGRCYETRVMACNCSCPRDRDSQCLSGFESGPDGHVWVSCN